MIEREYMRAVSIALGVPGAEMVERQYMRERWFAVLSRAMWADPRGMQGVADRLGKKCGRTALSLVLSGKYPVVPVAIGQRVMEVYDRHLCPYLGVAVQASFCAETSAGPVPIWDPSALELRRRCQTCEHKPEGGTK